MLCVLYVVILLHIKNTKEVCLAFLLAKITLSFLQVVQMPFMYIRLDNELIENCLIYAKQDLNFVKLLYLMYYFISSRKHSQNNNLWRFHVSFNEKPGRKSQDSTKDMLL